MKGIRLTALAGALILVAGWLPSAGAQGQVRARAIDLARGSRIGVTVQDVEDTDTKQPKSGVIVESVESGGPAEKAGVKAGDAITDFDGERVRSVRQFQRLVQETPSGRSVAVVLSRAGQRVNVTLTTERSSYDDFTYRLLETGRPAIPVAPTPPTPPAVRALPAPFEGLRVYGRGRLGVTLESLDEQLAQYFGVKDGVLVKSVATDSVAQKAGVKAGDVITSVNGRHVYEVPDVNRAMERAENTDEFTLEIMRDKKPMTLKGKFETTRPRGRGAMSF